MVIIIQGIDLLYKEFIEILKLPDDKVKEERYRDFFKKINDIIYVEDFNWARDVVEKIHVIERGSSAAIHWVDLDNWVEKKYSYEEFVKRSNKLVNFLRGNDLLKGSRVYVMLPLIPEIFFSTYAVVKGGFIQVPTAMNLTSRDLEYRFKAFPPDAVIADETSSKIIDEALERSGTKPKTKIIVGADRSGWESFDAINRERDHAEAERTSSDDVILAFFTSGTTGLPKIVAHTATSYPIGHLSTAMFINVKPGEKHNNLSAPGWAKFA